MNTVEPKKDFVGYRCLIQGRLKTASFLHIGSEKPFVPKPNQTQEIVVPAVAGEAAETQEKEATPTQVVVGADGRAIIPATALRGAIRDRLTRLKEDFGKDLMGTAAESSEDYKKPAPEPSADALANDGEPVEQASTGKARRVFVQTAMMIDQCPATIIFDDPLRCVDRIALTAMSRWRRAPQDKMLRSVEAVPPGVEFSVSIGINGSYEDGMVSADEIAAVLWSLGCGQDNSADQTNATPRDGKKRNLRLGAFTKDGWGQLEWTTCKITTLTQHGLQQWLEAKPDEQTGAQGWRICSEPVDTKCISDAWKVNFGATSEDAKSHGRNRVTLSLTLDCKSTFFTHDQRSHTKEAVALAAKNDPNKPPAELAKVMRVDGRAWLSGQSLKGAMRSQFERILRTCGIWCCDPSLEEKQDPKSLTKERCEPIRNVKELWNLCPACQVFGAGGWASTIGVSEFQETEPSEDARREFLAIDRFTGGGVPHLKFSADVAMQPKLSGEIGINFDRLKRVTYRQKKDSPESSSFEPMLGALLFLFRDFAEGDIPVGAGRSKGFGAFTIKSPSVRQTEKNAEPSVSPEEKDGAKQFAGALKALLDNLDHDKSPMECIPDKIIKETVCKWLKSFEEWRETYHNDHPDLLAPSGTTPEWWNSLTKPEDLVPQPQRDDSQTEPLPGSFNPYHWVPAAQTPKELLTSIDVFGKKPLQRHDVYAANGISGEMAVTLKPITPIFVGGQRKTAENRDGGSGESSEPATVLPYTVGNKPAIPGTSLRGLLSSTYEIASASAMRVLDDDKFYSHRMAADQNVMFHLIGQVAEDGKQIVPWNRRPNWVDPQKAFKNLDEWRVVNQVIPKGEGQTVNNSYYCLDFGSEKRNFPDGRNGRCHELQLHTPNPLPSAIPISDTALSQFQRLADDCLDATGENESPRPYEPKGQPRNNSDKKDDHYLIKANDLVYFKTNESGTIVERLSLAQIWRDDIGESIGEKFYKSSLSPLSVTMLEDKPVNNRKDLTLAETAFGFVIQEKKCEGKNRRKLPPDRLPAFASKIVISDATLPQDWEEERGYLTPEAKTLKILSSPKPPSAAFYFDPITCDEHPGGRLAAYAEIAKGKSGPRGRKIYLHLNPQSQDATGQTWNTSRAEIDKKQQVKIRCIGTGSIFTFTVAFDNLSLPEFCALCYSLQPTKGYMHKLGMAKPLGLGSVSLGVESVKKVDRVNRYTSEGFLKSRFALLAGSSNTSDSIAATNWIKIHAEIWRNFLSKKYSLLDASFFALEKIGTTQVDRLQYPMTRTQESMTDADKREKELFQWPSGNQRLTTIKGAQEWTQFLRPITEVGGIYPLPWRCNVIVIGNALSRQQLPRLESVAYHCDSVADMAEASAKITTYKTTSQGAVVFVVGLSPVMNGAEFSSLGIDVRTVVLKPEAGTEDQKRKARESNCRVITNLSRALELGAKGSHDIQVVGG